ncbi:uncharacterized protein LOC117180599 [Belonocnema kinseyi]|uniref:uncharacterized protein LOC117180599 n=1 Tax=Belonocnema kinseyi TaxID=2817044 RepID=UPI00143DC762|nr:uncharacterized protein LOC117180599 [Belonocnema kinseyi]
MGSKNENNGEKNRWKGTKIRIEDDLTPREKEVQTDRVSTNEKISSPSTSTCQAKYCESGLHDGLLDSDAALIVTKVEITEEEETVAISNLDLNSTSTKISRDPLKWPLEENDDIRLLLVKKGPILIREKDNAEGKFPKDECGRRFNESYYQRRMCNGEIILRSWLIYSKSADAVFCFCWKLFTTIQSALTSGGCNDWNHIGERLSSHEKSKAYLSAHKQWTELALRMRTNKTIDANHQRMLDDEARYWQNVLERLLAVIHFLAQQYLTFRGTSDKLYVHNNGNFSKLVELISKFDTVISEHLLRIKDGRTQQHYLGKDIQNEIIHLLANKIKQTILNIVKNAKYYSIIVDCTSDVSHIEQMTIIIRCVNIRKSPVEVGEYFLGGQGYDNGSNMKEKHAGVQQRISEINPLAFFAPSSPLRWDVLKKYIPSLTVKPLSTTRWESRIDAIRPIRYQKSEIYDALLDISSNESFDAMVRHEAECLTSAISDFIFLCCLITWHNILNHINVASKLLQIVDTNLSSAINELNGVLKYLESYRSDDGFASTITDAKELTEILGVASDFNSAQNVRPRRQKKQFDYESED